MESTHKVSILKSIKKLFAVLKLDAKDISAIYMFAILAGLVQLSLPLGIQTIISLVIAGSISTSIVVLIALVVVGTFLYGLLQIRQMQVIERVEQKLFLRYSFDFTDRLPKINVEKMDNYYLPELVNRFFEVISLQKGLEKLLLDLPTAAIQIILGIILLAFYHPVFIGFGMALLLITFIIIRVTSLEGLTAALKASDYKYGIANWIEEIARAIKIFKYTKGTSIHLNKSDQLLGGYLSARTSYFKILLTQSWTLVAFKVLITAGMLIVGTLLLVDQQINIGQFIAVDIVILTIMGSIEKLIGNLEKLYDALTSVEKLSKITEAEQEESGTLTLDNKIEGVSIKFSNVSYGYPNQKQVLNNIELTIEAGKTVHLSGKSGSGKSTLLRLLTGAFKNFEGSIQIEDIPIGNYNLPSLRSLTGILLHDQNVFHGTLLENLTMGNKDISVEEIMTLSKIVGLNAFIQSLPNGLDTVLAPQGSKLTLKIKRNIALCRALLGQHRLLLLESPFDHLTEKEEVEVLNFIKKNKKSTVILTSSNNHLANKCEQEFILN